MTWNTMFLFVSAAALAYGTLEVASQRPRSTISSEKNKCKGWPFPSHDQLEYASAVTASLREMEARWSKPKTTWAWDFGMEEEQLIGSHIFLYDEKEVLWHMERRDESEILHGCVSRAWKVSDSLKSNDGVERNTPFAAKLLNINDAEKKRGILYTNEVEALQALNRLEAHSILSHPWPNDNNRKVVRCQNRYPYDLIVTEPRCSEGATAAIVYKTAPGIRLSKFRKQDYKYIKQVLADTVFNINYKSNIALRQITADNVNVYSRNREYQVAIVDLSMAVNLRHVRRVPADNYMLEDLNAVHKLLGVGQGVGAFVRKEL